MDRGGSNFLHGGIIMKTRILPSIALIVIVYITLGYSMIAHSTSGIEPCFAKKLPQLKMLPAGMTIIQVIGHEFRNSDKCAPFHVTFTWENHYDRGDGHTYYSLTYVHTFPGELWYRTDKEEYTIVANPAHWEGLNKIRSFTGSGQVCTRKDENETCEDLRKFDRDQLRAKQIAGVHLSALSYGYPGVTTRGESVPIAFYAQSSEFEFRNTRHKWQPGGGLVEINNAALVSFDYPAIVEAASEQGTYTTTVSYNQNNDVQDIPSGHKGKLVITLDFDQRCDGNNQAEIDPCQQIAELLNDLESALELRDLYMEVAPNANDEFHIDELVMEKLRLRHPDMDSEKEAWLLNNAGGTNPRTGEIDVPDFCDECAAHPLCSWRGDIIKMHETTHKEYLQNNPEAKLLLTDTDYQMSNYTDVNQLGRAKAAVIADMEYTAYNERAKYIRSLINDQINQSSGCTFNPQFYSDIDALVSRIKY